MVTPPYLQKSHLPRQFQHGAHSKNINVYRGPHEFIEPDRSGPMDHDVHILDKADAVFGAEAQI